MSHAGNLEPLDIDENDEHGNHSFGFDLAESELKPELLETRMAERHPKHQQISTSVCTVKFETAHNNKFDESPLRTTFIKGVFRVLLVGDPGVGKTAFFNRACSGEFAESKCTIGCGDMFVKTFEIDGRHVALEFWDTAGQERYRSIVFTYFRRADGVLLMYDITQPKTFCNIGYWMKEAVEAVGRIIPFVLCGNKVDMRGADNKYRDVQCITHEQGLSFSQKACISFIETSPKNGVNIAEALRKLTLLMLRSVPNPVESLQESIRLENDRKEDDGRILTKKGRKCCN